jgi:hypothetical protein
LLPFGAAGLDTWRMTWNFGEAQSTGRNPTPSITLRVTLKKLPDRLLRHAEQVLRGKRRFPSTSANCHVKAIFVRYDSIRTG